MKEPIKTEFKLIDRENNDTFIPCKYCNALDNFPICDDGATSSACNHCDYSILLHCYCN